MIIKVNKKIEVTKMKEKIQLPKELQIKIDNFWKKEVEKNPHLFNGEVWSVTNFEELPDKIKMNIQKTNYAHYLFDERVGIEGKNACFNLSCGIWLETKDGQYIIGEMNETTSYSKGLEISGGSLDQNDIKVDGQVDIINNVARELKEELNVDLFDKTIVEEYRMQYMERPQGRRHSYAPMMKGILSITAKQMEKQYNEYKSELEQNGEDVEFKKLHFIKKENALEILKSLDNPKRPYLEDLIKLDSKSRENIER